MKKFLSGEKSAADKQSGAKGADSAKDTPKDKGKEKEAETTTATLPKDGSPKGATSPLSPSTSSAAGLDSKTQSSKKRHPLNVPEFWKYEMGLSLNQRRARYEHDVIVTVNDIMTWADSSPLIDEPVDRDLIVDKLERALASYDILIDKAVKKEAERQEQEAERAAKKSAKKKKKGASGKVKESNGGSDGSNSNSSSDSDESGSDSDSTKAKVRKLFMEPPQNPEDLIHFLDGEKFQFEPNEALNRKVSVWQGDISTLEIDAIVNAANNSLQGGGGIDGAIHRAAGESLYDECVTLGGCPTGSTKITRGHRLPAQWILHTVGPQVVSEKRPLPKSKLISCYESCFKLIEEYNIRTVAFCGVSTGIYHYPNDAATHTALSVARKWLEVPGNADRVDRIIFCSYTDDDRDIYEEMMHIYFPAVPRLDTFVLPCSDAAKWQNTVELLSQPISKIEAFLELLQKLAGRDLDLEGLKLFLSETINAKERGSFFKKDVAKIIELALRHPELFAKRDGKLRKNKKNKKKKSASNNTGDEGDATGDEKEIEDDSMELDFTNLRLLMQGMEQSIRLSQEQVASLVACAFLGILPVQSFHSQRFGNANFLDLYKKPTLPPLPVKSASGKVPTSPPAEVKERASESGSKKQSPSSEKTEKKTDAHPEGEHKDEPKEAPAPVPESVDDSDSTEKRDDELLLDQCKRNQFAKLQAVFHYFHKVISALPNEHEIVIRRKVFEDHLPDWRCGEERLVDVTKGDLPTYSCSRGEIQLVACHKLPGLHSFDLSPSVAAGEMRMYISPELFVVPAFVSELLPNESLEVRGAETFCACELDSDGILYFKADYDDKTETDDGVRRSKIILADPLCERDTKLQQRSYNIVRELNKLYCALYEEVEESSTDMDSNLLSPEAKKKKEKELKEKKKDLFFLPKKQPAFQLAVEDWGCDRDFGGDPYVKAVVKLLVLSSFNTISAVAPEKSIAKHLVDRPELHFHGSKAVDELQRALAILHGEQVASKYVTRMIFGKLQRNGASTDDNFCIRILNSFRGWKKELKRMKEERERERREEEKRKLKLREERIKMEKKMKKEREKQAKLKEKEEKDKSKTKVEEGKKVEDSVKKEDETTNEVADTAEKTPKSNGSSSKKKSKSKSNLTQTDDEGLQPEPAADGDGDAGKGDDAVSGGRGSHKKRDAPDNSDGEPSADGTPRSKTDEAVNETVSPVTEKAAADDSASTAAKKSEETNEMAEDTAGASVAKADTESDASTPKSEEPKKMKKAASKKAKNKDADGEGEGGKGKKKKEN